LAREIRFSIAVWLLTNAPAISPTLKPHKMFSTSATRTSSGQFWMAAGKHHAQLIFYRVRLENLPPARRVGPFALRGRADSLVH
jgi:hypothetical protein